MRLSRQIIIFTLLALVAAFTTTRGLVAQPGYTDAFYHYNAAERLVTRDGLTDPYLWAYIGAPDDLPAPSHGYWMPFTSLTAAFGMWLVGSTNYYAAQWPFALMYAGMACIAFWLGRKIGGSARHAWVAGLLALFSGFFVRFWGATDTFAPYALVGSLALVLIGLSVERGGWHWFALAGLFAGLGHLTRADGLLLLLVGWIVIVWNWARSTPPRRSYAAALVIFTLGYLLVMTPWFIRNLDVTGALLPVGGAQAIWYTEYNDIFNYPPGADPQSFFVDGFTTLFESRWTALVNNLGTFTAIEGLVAMAPLMLIGLWVRRHDRFLRAFWLYALGLHTAMTFVFPYPGYRGGLLHSAAALIPWWAALGVAGLDDTVDWIAARRRKWRPRTAKTVFSVGLVILALVLSINVALNSRVRRGTPDLYLELAAVLPPDARVMINDPAQLYYFTDLGGVVAPNEPPDVIPEIARRYNVTHLLIEFQGGEPAIADEFRFDFDNPPDFLKPVLFDVPNARLYAIEQ